MKPTRTKQEIREKLRTLKLEEPLGWVEIDAYFIIHKRGFRDALLWVLEGR